MVWDLPEKASGETNATGFCVGRLSAAFRVEILRRPKSLRRIQTNRSACKNSNTPTPSHRRVGGVSARPA